ncbi:hypothetical protein MGU_11786 [Metarhizium guizhouense ARSEF 977]|uniref:Uncharacterized protein n=1 Tax=Metarhizium guizhouense (strain ARSEF 977) TaxID=1276136 RepID=A0A0B4FH08_METGA|nr:hypothetical protein MGU_11786 [Metarhizium guizhouense ARSEF 977]
MLVYAEDITSLDSEELDLVPKRDNLNFVHEQCRAWRLTCCKEALLLDWPYWRSRLVQDEDEEDDDDDDQDEGDVCVIATRRSVDKTLSEELDDLVEKVKNMLEDDERNEDAEQSK